MRQAITVFVLIVALGSIVAAQNYQVRTRVDLVVVPTTVRDSDGKLIPGLEQRDFTITEDGKRQEISNFSVDPQPLSAAILVDTGMGGIALRRLSPLFITLTSGFSPFDEMASFRYDHLFHQMSEFTNDHEQLEKSFDVVKQIAEKQPATVPAGEPAPTAPKILRLLLGVLGGGAGGGRGGAPPDPHAPPTENLPTVRSGPVPQSRILYDAVFEAAATLQARAPDRRKIIFIIQMVRFPEPLRTRSRTLPISFFATTSNCSLSRWITAPSKESLAR